MNVLNRPLSTCEISTLASDLAQNARQKSKSANSSYLSKVAEQKVLPRLLADQGNIVRVVDKKPLTEWYQVHDDCDNLVLDLNDKANCYTAANGYNEVFNLAADMGGKVTLLLPNATLCEIAFL